MSDLKPCPFCGAVYTFEQGAKLWTANHKSDCFLRSQRTFLSLDCSQLEAWNRRAWPSDESVEHAISAAKELGFIFTYPEMFALLSCAMGAGHEG